jgi:hypothetical protein
LKAPGLNRANVALCHAYPKSIFLLNPPFCRENSEGRCFFSTLMLDKINTGVIIVAMS